jgi:hypothetical protein
MAKMIPNGFLRGEKTMTSSRRLDAIEESLTPEQVILKWVEDSNRFESLAEYIEAEQSKNGSDVPIWAGLEKSIQNIMKGMDLKAVQLATLKAKREVIFRYWIRIYLAELVASHIPLLEALDALCTEFTRSAIKEKGIDRLCASVERFDEFKYWFHSFFSLVLNLNCAAKYLQSKYFYDRPILWRSSAKVLEYMMDRGLQLSSFWSDCFFLMPPDRTKSGEIDDEFEIPPEIDWDALEKSIDPIENARSIVARARSSALAAVGDRDAAVAFLIPRDEASR